MTTPTLAAVTKGPCHELQEAIVAGLERRLEQARRGEFEGGLLIFERADSESLDWTVLGTNKLTQLVGRLELLKAALLASFTEED